jgi:hypothetical protein
MSRKGTFRMYGKIKGKPEKVLTRPEETGDLRRTTAGSTVDPLKIRSAGIKKDAIFTIFYHKQCFLFCPVQSLPTCWGQGL